MPTLNWIGKEAVINHHKDVPFKLLNRVDSILVGDNPSNLIIHGDNLEGLKALLPYYYNKVNCIYIDPPYNTGKEGWAYNDRVNSPKIKEWLGKIVGGEVEDLTRHDKWLCMMAPRLTLLRELLSEGGVIFISIDQNELHNLRSLMDEIFGEENFIEIFSWVKTSTPPGLSHKSRKTVEYILCYENGKTDAKYKGELLSGGDQPLLNRGNRYRTLIFPSNSVVLKVPDGEYVAKNYGRVDLKTKLIVKNGVSDIDVVLGGEFKWTQKTLDKEVSLGTSFIVKSKQFSIRFIRNDEGKYKAPTNMIKDKYITPVINKTVGVGTNETASSELLELFGEKKFDYPKPVSLVKFLINLCADKDAIILDSFAGSGTTGHAVLDLNKEDGGNRKFIMIELENNVAKDITAERIKRAINKYSYKDGFEYCELGKSLFDGEGKIDNACTFKELANYIFFTETQVNIDTRKITSNFLGSSTDTDYYLIYKGRGQNDLDKKFLGSLRESNNKRVIYADRCLLDEEIIQKHNITFKQIPYEIKIF